MSALGHSLHSHSDLGRPFVRYAPNSDHSGLASGRPQSASTRHSLEIWP